MLSLEKWDDLICNRNRDGWSVRQLKGRSENECLNAGDEDGCLGKGVQKRAAQRNKPRLTNHYSYYPALDKIKEAPIRDTCILTSESIFLAHWGVDPTGPVRFKS